VQNNLSNFAEKAVAVLASKGDLDWDKKDSKGYTPLMLAAYHGNVWLVRHLVDKVKVNPNDPSQRTKAAPPQVYPPISCLLPHYCRPYLIARAPPEPTHQLPFMFASLRLSVHSHFTLHTSHSTLHNTQSTVHQPLSASIAF
jgi:ankyrin repeat protein